MLSVTVGECTRKAAEHKEHADALKRLGGALGEFLAKHTERRDKTVTGATHRLKSLDSAFAAVKQAEADFDRFSAEAARVEAEQRKYLDDERMAKSPVMEKLSTQLGELSVKVDAAQREFKVGLEKALALEKLVYDRDLPTMLQVNASSPRKCPAAHHQSVGLFSDCSLTAASAGCAAGLPQSGG